MSRPALFVGSSSEGLAIAQGVQVLLDPVCEVTLWTQGVFGLTYGTLESLVTAVSGFDFAVLVLTADDLNISRGAANLTARDNVLFELGLFIGSLGRDRTFILHDSAHPPVLPSDLAGVTPATFVPREDENLEAALGAPCTRIQREIERLGIREGRVSRTVTRGNQFPPPRVIITTPQPDTRVSGEGETHASGTAVGLDGEKLWPVVIGGDNRFYPQPALPVFGGRWSGKTWIQGNSGEHLVLLILSADDKAMNGSYSA